MRNAFYYRNYARTFRKEKSFAEGKQGRKLKQLLKAENPNLILFYDGLGPTKKDTA
ncbi:MAG: hypothetical protein R2758_11905 [Bacteroidales bacterium]